MELVNHTPIPADLRTSYLPNTPNRRGWLTAKATFRFDSGRAELDRDAPLGVLVHKQDHDFGYLPPDFTTAARDPFEVMLLGAVETPAGAPVTHRRVTMAVGDVVREIDVFGDRVWNGDTMSEPAPFETMPLTWDRAFGGTAEIEIDAGAKVKVRDPMNPLGRGFDVAPHAAALAHELNPPDGYPKFSPMRSLPNLERPERRIASPSDAPRPVCWAPMPSECGLRVAHVMSRMHERMADPNPVKNQIQYEDERELIVSATRHAHPDWWIPRPHRGARLQLTGVCASEDLDLELPALRLLGDYSVGNRSGCRELVPQSLVVLVSERRFCITYRASFLVRYEPGTERGFRLRTEEGWYENGHE